MTIFTKATIMHHATKAKIDRINDSLVVEWPTLRLQPVMAEDEQTVLSIQLQYHDAPDAEWEAVKDYDFKDVPSVGDLAADAMEAEFDLDAIEADEGPSGSVVAEKYRVAYREVSSTKRSCGDWLAEWLADETVGADKKTDIDLVMDIFVGNGLDMTAKWAMSRGHGWRGRFRMNGRQVLEKEVAWNGYVRDANGTPVVCPDEELEVLRAKHAKYMAKREKQEAAARAVAEAAAGA